MVDAEDQISHELSLDDELVAETGLDVFKVDPEVRLHDMRSARFEVKATVSLYVTGS